MRHFHVLRNREHCPIVNLDKLWSLVPEEVFQKAKEAAGSGQAPVIDVTKAGYFKVSARKEGEHCGTSVERAVRVAHGS